MNLRFLQILLICILTSCAREEISIVFENPNPRKDAICRSKVKNVYYIIDSVSIDTNIYSNNYIIGDTMLFHTYDSLGNTRFTHLSPAFSTKTNYDYDRQGNLTYKRIFSDYMSEYHLATFIDTAKRIKYLKEIDPYSDYKIGMTYYNKKGLPDSATGFTIEQNADFNYNEYYYYKGDTLVMTIRKITSDNRNKNLEAYRFFPDSTKYIYNKGKLFKIMKTGKNIGMEQYYETEHFDVNGKPLKKEFSISGKYLRYKISSN